MKEFRCGKCLKLKKDSLLAFTYKSGSNERKCCTACEIAIEEAKKKRE